MTKLLQRSRHPDGVNRVVSGKRGCDGENA